MELAMNTIDWQVEHSRFMAVAYDKAKRAATRAFRGWPDSKREDAEAEFMGKVWDQWWRVAVERGKDPEPLLYPFLHWAKRWVQYDRRIAGRPRNIDLQDFRAGMTAHLMDGRGELEPHDRSARINGFLDWSGTARTDDPSDLAAALETSGISLSQWCDI
jgi:hypothetical protein